MERIAVILGKMNMGGIESIVMEYYANLDHTRYQYDFYISEESARIPQIEISKYGGRVFLLPKITHVFKYKRVLKKYLKDGRYNIMHVHLTTLAVFALKAGKKAKIPVRISHAHSTTSFREGLKFFVKQLLRPLANLYVTDRFACSKSAGEWLFGKRQVKKGKVTVIPNGINAVKFKFDKTVRAEMRKELGLEKNYVIGHVGRLVTPKNQKFLIDVFYQCEKQMPHARLVIVGSGELEEKLKSRVTKLKLDGKVLFLGGRTDINNVMQAFDCFALPSIYEGFGLVAVEALCSGLPCVCSNKVPEFPNLNEGIRYISLNKKTEWINRLLNPPITDRDNAYQLIRSNGFDMPLCAEDLMRRYDGFLVGKQGHNEDKREYLDLISVLVPVYNLEKEVKQCLDSIVNQTYKNIEIIVVDDGSTDGSADICDEYLIDGRVKVIHQQNQGIAMTRNVLLENASGKYITFIDGDDFVSPYYVENLYYAISSSGASMSICGFRKFTCGDDVSYSKYTEDISVMDVEEYISSVLYQINECGVPCKMYTAEVAKNLEYAKGVVYEDVRVLPQLFSQLETVAKTSALDYYYRYRSSSATNAKFSESNMECLEQMKIVRDYILENYPNLESAMDCRYFSAVCSLFVRVDKKEYQNIYFELWQDILKYRKTASSDKRARRKTRYAGMIAKLGGTMLRAISKLLGVN